MVHLVCRTIAVRYGDRYAGASAGRISPDEHVRRLSGRERASGRSRVVAAVVQRVLGTFLLLLFLDEVDALEKPLRWDCCMDRPWGCGLVFVG
jgi:hypothetical protein